MGIFWGMRAECAYNESVNTGTINVRVLQDYSQSVTAISNGSPMYMMAPEGQTLGDFFLIDRLFGRESYR